MKETETNLIMEEVSFNSAEMAPVDPLQQSVNETVLCWFPSPPSCPICWSSSPRETVPLASMMDEMAPGQFSKEVEVIVTDPLPLKESPPAGQSEKCEEERWRVCSLVREAVMTDVDWREEKMEFVISAFALLILMRDLVNAELLKVREESLRVPDVASMNV